MKTIEQLQAEHAKQIANLKAEHAIAQKFVDAGLPVPTYIGGKLFGAIGVTYDKVGAMTKAIELMASFPILVPFAVLRNGFTSMMPESSLKLIKDGDKYKRDEHRNSGNFAARIGVRHIEDSPAPTFAEIEFFTRIDGVLFSVSIKFGSGYIGSCPRLAPHRVETRGYARRLQSVRFDPNAMLYGMGDSFLAYGSGDMGPIKTSADHRYLFVSDYGSDECNMSEGAAHAIAQFRNIAQQIGE